MTRINLKDKAKTSPTMASGQGLEELRIAHVTNANRITNANRKPIDFGKIREKVTATLVVAQSATTAVEALKAATSGAEKAMCNRLKRKLESLSAELTTLQRKLA